MKRFFVCLMLVIVCYFIYGIHTVTAQEYDEEKIYHEINYNLIFDKISLMVVLKNKYSFSDFDYEKEFNNIEYLNIENISTSIDIKEYSEKDQKRLHRILKINFEEKTLEEFEELINKLMLIDCVLYVEPNYIVEASYIPSDSYYGTDGSWGLGHIGLPDAWDFTLGSNDVEVAVIDSGIDGTHSELSGVIDVNKSRVCSGDLIQSVTSVIDDYGHGTHVAGIIAATHNSVGVAGVCSKISLISVKVLDSAGHGDIASIARALNYVESIDVPITNVSLRQYNNVFIPTWRFESFHTAVSNYSGLLVCSAGNDNIDLDDTNNNLTYPAAFNDSNILSVGAIDSYNNKCSFSNYGQNSVDVYAPGYYVLSTYPSSLYLTGSVGVYGSHYTIGYAKMSGTSMAAPFVTGVASLLLSLNPNLNNVMLKNSIINGGISYSLLVAPNTYHNVKLLDAFGALKYAYYNYAFPSYTFSGSPLTISKPCSFTYEFVSLNEAVCRINMTTLKSLSFSITSNYAIDVELYDQYLSPISITKTYSNNNKTITFMKQFFPGNYFYIRVYFPSNTNFSTINISIT